MDFFDSLRVLSCWGFRLVKVRIFIMGVYSHSVCRFNIVAWNPHVIYIHWLLLSRSKRLALRLLARANRSILKYPSTAMTSDLHIIGVNYSCALEKPFFNFFELPATIRFRFVVLWLESKRHFFRLSKASCLKPNNVFLNKKINKNYENYKVLLFSFWLVNYLNNLIMVKIYQYLFCHRKMPYIGGSQNCMASAFIGNSCFPEPSKHQLNLNFSVISWKLTTDL